MGRVGAGERPTQPRNLAGGCSLPAGQPGSRSSGGPPKGCSSLEPCAIPKGAQRHPHSLGTLTPALGRGYFAISFLMWEVGRWGGYCWAVLLFSSLLHSKAQQIALGSSSPGCEVNRLTLQELQGCSRPCYSNSPPLTRYSLPST